MRDHRWVSGPHDCTNLVSDEGELLGYVSPLSTGGTRGYAIRRDGSGPARFEGISDHPAEAEARTWVEATIKMEAGHVE